jgi:hypothetical protein
MREGASVTTWSSAGMTGVCSAPALLQDRRYVEVKAETLAANWPDSRRELFGRLGLPDADTVNTFAASRLAVRRGQLSDTEHAEVVSRLGWAAGDLGYPATP